MNILSLLKKQYFPLNKIELSKKNLLSNYAYLREAIGQNAIAPVLKSNAYGHGLVEIAKAMDNVGAPFYCVDSLYEAYQLLHAKIKTPILIMGYIQPENLSIKKLPFSYAVFSYEMLSAIKKYQPHAGVHIFLDTGMHREGVQIDEVKAFVRQAKKLGLSIQGLLSHFAMGNKPKNKQTIKQVKNFIQAQKIVQKEGVFPKWIHLPASLGILHAQEYPHIFNVGRAGIALYGIDPEGIHKNLAPVLVLTTKIVQIKEIKKGEKIGYDFSFTAKNNMKLGMLPIGYNDGVNVRLSNKGVVKVGKYFCPIVGRINMNITVIDITKCRNVKVGDEVTMYSNNTKDKNSISSVAKLCRTIPYEILIQLHTSTKRIIA